MNQTQPFEPIISSKASGSPLLRVFVLMGAVNAFLAVAFGAFGAHALKDRLAATGNLPAYQTAAQYHLTHSLALLLVALLADRLTAQPLVRAVGMLFTIGIVLFSGSLYLLAVTDVKILGAITPLGGLCFLTGWALLAFAAAKEPR